MADTLVTTSGTSTFDVLYQGRSRARGSNVTVEWLPWSDSYVVWSGGRSDWTLSLTLMVADGTNLTMLESQVSESGTLTYVEGALSVVLLDISTSEYWSGGKQKVRARFAVTA